jgi:hypothetical protein
MGYEVKIQRIQRKGTSSYYINFPVAVAEAIDAVKGETWSWSVEDKNTLVFQRLKPKANRKTSNP